MKQKYSDQIVKEILNNKLQLKSIKLIGHGNHSEAYLINEELVIKLPKTKKASDCLNTEIKVLENIQSKFNINIPTVEFTGKFNDDYTYYVSKYVEGINLTSTEFKNLPNDMLDYNAKAIAEFLYKLHNQKQILNIKRKDLVLLHGDFSLNHVLFDKEGKVVGILDFADARGGKYMSDFKYLLDDEDQDEFGSAFGNKVLEEYKKLNTVHFKNDFKHIEGPIVNLDLILTNDGKDKELPYYWFNIVEKKTSKNVGKISLRIGHNYHSYFNGNIGYEVDEEYRGNNYAYHACLMVLELAKNHNMKELYITCEYDNVASIKTIEKLDVDLVDEVVPPKDYVFYYDGIAKHKIYKIELYK